MSDTWNNNVTIMLDLDKLGDESFVRAWLDTWIPFADEVLIPDIETEDESRVIIDNYDDPKISFVGKEFKAEKDLEGGWFAKLLPSEFMHTEIQQWIKKGMRYGNDGRTSVEIFHPVMEFYFDFEHYTVYDKPYFYKPRDIAYPYRKVKTILSMFKYYLIGDSRAKRILSNNGHAGYLKTCWERWENTRSVDEAMRGNMGFPHVNARINEGLRKELKEFSHQHPHEIQRRLEHFKHM
ncbi:MAG: hypothetical protein ACW99U_12650 [Candidatus Thorarchaeota archaeon]|jgi:hypothetical protein